MMFSKFRSCCLMAALLGGAFVPARGQQEKPQEAAPPQASPHGEVLFERHTEPQQQPEKSAAGAEKKPEPPPEAVPDIDDEVRAALVTKAYDLDVRLEPAEAKLSARARLTVRNAGAKPLRFLALQVSSALHWESVSVGGEKLPLAEHNLQTDIDHTGSASEAVLTLPEPLAPGAALTLDAFYSGVLRKNAERLQRIGATHEQAAQADWDEIGPTLTALRGFGNVLWYPVSEPQVFLGQGADLFHAIARRKLQEAGASVALRLSVAYLGEPPAAAWFCGRKAELHALSDAEEAPAGEGIGLARAEFAAAPVGFRALSLFVADQAERTAATVPGSDGSTPMLDVVSEAPSFDPMLAATANDAAGVVVDWLGPRPQRPMTVIDHAGQPFEDGALLVAPLSSLATGDGAPAMTHGLAHAWLLSGQPWMDEGLAQFFVLLATERGKGRDSATAQLAELMQPLQLAEPEFARDKPAVAGEPLIAAADEVYYRRKAAAVWWMLRDLAGEDALKLTLAGWRRQTHTGSPEEVATAFEHALEATTSKDFAWFFRDWVFADKGLPDLTVVDVTPRELPAAVGKSTGWLVSVTVRNDGAAVADVPVVVRSGSYSTTQRMRINGFESVTTRIVVEAPPTEIVVNDGTTPEQRVAVHSRQVVVRSK